MPFRKTPANILARGVEYSPVGIFKNILDIVSVATGKSDKTVPEIIDGVAATLTGTELAVLGAFLVSQGILRGFGGDDEKEKEYEELTGHQQYALEIGNVSVSLDWLAPESIPFFIGANMAELYMQNGLDFNGFAKSLLYATEPMLSMSCLQGFNDMIDSVRYAEMNGVEGTVINVMASYFSQGIPTFLGQLERTTEKERMTTYTSPDYVLLKDLQYPVGRASARIPVVEYSQIPYIDAWGRTEDNGGVAIRAFNNVLNPAYTSKISESPMEKELLRVYQDTGENVLPKRASKYFNIGTERVNLTAEEYVKYAKAYGGKSYNLLTNIVKTNVYKKATNAEKVDYIERVYDYANATAKVACRAKNSKNKSYTLDGWYKEVYDTCKNTKLDEATYIMCLEISSKAGKYQDNDNETIDGSHSLCIMRDIYNQFPNLTRQQYEAMFTDFGVSKQYITKTKSGVEKELAKYKKYKYIDKE